MLPVDTTVHFPMLMLVGVPSFPELEAVGRVECRSPRRTTSAMMTVRPPRVMFAVPVMALRRDTLLPESFQDVNYARKTTLGRCDAHWISILLRINTEKIVL